MSNSEKEFKEKFIKEAEKHGLNLKNENRINISFVGFEKDSKKEDSK